jgi:hypothetical protein
VYCCLLELAADKGSVQLLLLLLLEGAVEAGAYGRTPAAKDELAG